MGQLNGEALTAQEQSTLAFWEEVLRGAGAQGHGSPPPPHSDRLGQTDGTGLSTLSHGPDIILSSRGGYLLLPPSSCSQSQ